jgi:colanic acid biosynthesis glycosyl transferase WcaI
MRLIILNQFFYPDHSATSQLMTDLAQSLVANGVEVTAIAGRGRYNGGEKLARYQVHDGIKIRRAWSTNFGKKSLAARLCDYASFFLGAAWELLRVPRHDIVMALTTPPLIGVVALLIGRMRRMRVVSLVQDLYPDVAVALGALSETHPATRLLDWLNRFMLRGVDRIIVLSECMRERIADKVSNRSSAVDVIHNWADGDKIKPAAEENSFLKTHGLEGAFVVLFSGNFGNVNEFSTVLEAASLLRDRANIVFLFIGDGARAGEITDFAASRSLDNIRVLPYQPQELLPLSLTAGQVSLVTLADGLAGLSVPSKTYGILAAGRPVLFVGDLKSEIARLVQENGCGAVFKSGESRPLAQTILEWASDPDKAKASGRSARNLFENRFDRPIAMAAYMRCFNKCMETQPRPLKSGLTATGG